MTGWLIHRRPQDSRGSRNRSRSRRFSRRPPDRGRHRHRRRRDRGDDEFANFTVAESTTDLVESWSKPCFNENVALILGPPSGNVWALDIDVKDWRLSSATI